MNPTSPADVSDSELTEPRPIVGEYAPPGRPATEPRAQVAAKAFDRRLG
jgi:hypothetical protein